MSVNVTTSANGQALNELLTPLVLGATSIERGLMRVIPNQMNSVAVSRFATDLDKLEAPVATPSTPNDSMSKDEVIIQTGDAMFYDTFNPLRDFEDDWVWFWSQGQLTDAQAAAKIREAILKTVTESVHNNLEKLIWEGDTASGSAFLNRFDGFIKLIEADADVNNVTPAGALTAANIIDTLDAMIAATSDEVLELKTPTIVLSHRDKQLYFQALRDTGISKGVNVTESGIPTYGGIRMVSTGIPKDHLVLTNTGTGNDSNLAAATWMNADYNGVKIDRLQNNSEEWFCKVLFKFGVNFMFGDQITYYKPV